jgi:hypothetical protein
VGLNVGSGKTLTVGGTQTMSALTASTALALNSSKNIVSVTNTGTGNNVLSASPTLTGTIDAAAQTLSGNLTLSGGTANGVLYLNASKVATSGSALTYDGTSFVGPNFRANSFIEIRSDTANLYWENAANTRYYSTALTGTSTSPTLATTYFDGTSVLSRLALDSSGNLGLGVTPSAWVSSARALQIKNYAAFAQRDGTSDLILSWNATVTSGTSSGTGYVYRTTGDVASTYEQAGSHRWYIAPSGTAGNAITFTQALTLDANRNLLLNGTAAPASGVGTFAMFNGTAPTGSVTNGCVLYTEDVSSSSELKVRDEAGNVTTLSPHNFSLIPEGPSEDMAWSYYSERDGKRINIDMLKAIRVLEKLSGEKLVHES